MLQLIDHAVSDALMDRGRRHHFALSRCVMRVSLNEVVECLSASVAIWDVKVASEQMAEQRLGSTMFVTEALNV